MLTVYVPHQTDTYIFGCGCMYSTAVERKKESQRWDIEKCHSMFGVIFAALTLWYVIHHTTYSTPILASVDMYQHTLVSIVLSHKMTALF